MRVGLWTCGAMLTACSGAVAPTADPLPVQPAAVPEAQAGPNTEAEPVDATREPEAPPPAEQGETAAPTKGSPTKTQALKASKAVLKGKLAQLAPIVPLSDGRAAVVWRNFTGVSEASVELVVLAQADGVWTAQNHETVTAASTPWLDDGPPPLAVTARSEDYDDDGEPEILVRVRVPEMCPGGGPNTITEMKIFDLNPTLEPALSTELRHLMDAYPEEATKAKVTHEDVDGDGHRDVKIVYVSKSEGVSDTALNVWRYVPEKDAWALHKPEYERWGCDW